MPRGDKTGPDGKGPLTGRGLGSCDPNDLKKLKDMGVVDPSLMQQGRGRTPGRGLGRGPGTGRGFRRRGQ